MNFSGDFTCHCGIRPKTAPECNPVTHSLISKWKYSNLFFRVLLLCLIRFWTSLDNIFSLNLRFSSFVGNRTSSLSVMSTSGMNSPSWKCMRSWEWLSSWEHEVSIPVSRLRFLALGGAGPDCVLPGVSCSELIKKLEIHLNFVIRYLSSFHICNPFHAFCCPLGYPILSGVIQLLCFVDSIKISRNVWVSPAWNSSSWMNPGYFLTWWVPPFKRLK